MAVMLGGGGLWTLSMACCCVHALQCCDLWHSLAIRLCGRVGSHVRPQTLQLSCFLPTTRTFLPLHIATNLSGTHHAASCHTVLLLPLQASQEELVAQVDKDLRTMLLKPDAPQPRVVGVRVWPRAIPQFNVGHLDTLDEAKQVRRCSAAALRVLRAGTLHC